MKISILLPYKENFSPTYPGAVSLFIKDTSKISKFKKSIIIFGNTKYDKKFKIKYFNLKLEKETLKSQSKSYVTEFIKIEKSDPSSIIEIHNRPIYLKYIYTEIYNPKFILYFHNDPLTMIGSKTVKDRKFLLDVCSKIIFNSNWSKKRFLQGMGTTYINSDKLLVIYQSATKKK